MQTELKVQMGWECKLDHVPGRWTLTRGHELVGFYLKLGPTVFTNGSRPSSILLKVV